MRKITVILTIILTLTLYLGDYSFAEGILWQNISQEENSIKTVLVDPNNPLFIYFGSDNGIFKSEDGGESWRNVLSLNGQNQTINLVLFDPADKNCLYAAGSDGLFYSPDAGKNWNRIFKAEADSGCAALSVLPYGIYLGGQNGLLVSKDQGLSWQKEKDELGRNPILNITHNPKEPSHIYTATAQKIFLSPDQGETWKDIFKAGIPMDAPEEENEETEIAEPEEYFKIRHIAIDRDLNYLYAATSRGLYRTKNKGQSWQAISVSGLSSPDITFILISPASAIYAAIQSRIFEYKDGYWQELSIGLNAGQIHYLAQDNSGSLYAAADKGLFKTVPRDDLIGVIDFTTEPDIRQVQKAAIEYAEVDPEKITRWRKQAAKKALLPQVSVGVDRNTSDLWHWEGGSTTRTDDDILRRGRDTVDWDLTLSWDLGDLIWNNDQTSIDTRSKLMVQLRGDILDEATRTYFERLRLKKELERLTPDDRGKMEEKKLRLEELTANLDALTGGYFSRDSGLTADADKRHTPS